MGEISKERKLSPPEQVEKRAEMTALTKCFKVSKNRRIVEREN